MRSPACLITIPCLYLFSLSISLFSLSLSPEGFNEAWLLNPRTAYCYTHRHTHTLLPASVYSAPSAAATSRHRLNTNTHLLLPIFHCGSVCASLCVRVYACASVCGSIVFISLPSSSLIGRLFDQPQKPLTLPFSPCRLSL